MRPVGCCSRATHCVQLGLRRGQVREDPVGAELGAHRPVEPLDLPGRGRRPGLGQQVLDAVLPADPVEEHLHRRPVEPAGEHLAVVGQDLLRAPRRSASPPPAPHRPAARTPAASERADTEPGVVIDPGQRLGPASRPPAGTRRPRPAATAPSAPRAPTASTSGPAAAAPPGRSGSTGPTPDRPPTPTAPAPRPAWPARRPAAADPTTDAPAAAPTTATSTTAGI